MILDEINKITLEDVKKREEKISLEDLENVIEEGTFYTKDVKSFLKSTKDEAIRIIAEVKKASPSKGVIKEDFDPIFIAKEYNKYGANAISVLTEPHYFKGDLNYLKSIRSVTDIPLLRKDFILTKYQIAEALVYGADFILLIAKSLSQELLNELYEYAIGLNLEVLVEIHDEEDLQKALNSGANIIGINHRDLKTFKMDMELCEKLIPKIPKDKIVVAESGVSDINIIKKLHKIGADAFLIGEHFMRVPSIKDEMINFKNSLE
ncbi:indole-3-glycerol phosphate synthase TrpC [Arcobacter porcinus]|uniref:Indole-3-glycerol phosphate synthase n=1 Tax=Arcobacter porcinus TaxID=1935204 RepID=A0A1C0AZ32_9BACT|nr:indole-3-glycerol phosphate synthase TrpC [Arcobacter porcinus]OCL92352.1 Indole-3-glycerol phosphate synthase [Aliarcobacter thereius]OCL82698.1 Indole-3-glycerol phosphate synthase [Arcobacter porcinus]OCL85214.1 Indole-3-glycerol phosphate synthase [Arcobacter porcinus]OCL85662.1 Indole-3-glycerol phosphate synthase [Arcobacter porcinus]OCL92884.1 Indole-3-glycerol phosphate synthase [Arcobacter porcinus]